MDDMAEQIYAELRGDWLDAADARSKVLALTDSESLADAVAALVAAEPKKEILAKVEAMRQRALAKETPKRLAPVRHPQRDFFVADIFDAVPKDDIASMEHPLFALKAGDKRQRVYERNGITVAVRPGYDGCATIHDKDVWIYCISQLVAAMNDGRAVNRTVRFIAYDFLVSTNRRTDGDAYERMKDALDRLRSTSINTTIEIDGYREARGFGLVDHWRVVEEKVGRMVAVEVTLPEWLWRSVQSMQVLTISRDYFRIRKPLDRRLYELARKHCGNQSKWLVSLAVLHEKCSSSSSTKEFRRSIRELAQTNDLPDYAVSYNDETDNVTFAKR